MMRLRLRERGSPSLGEVTGTTSKSTGHAMRLWGTVKSRRARWRRKGILCTCTGSALQLVGKGSAFCRSERGGRAAAARVLLAVLLLCFSSCGRVESRRASPRTPAARSATPSGDESPPFTLAPNSVDDIAGRERFLSRLVGTRGAPNATAIRRSFSDEEPWTEEREAPGIGTNGRMQFLDGAGSIDFPTRDAHQFSRRRRISGRRPSNPEEGGEEQPARTQRLDRADSFDFLPSHDGTGLGLRGLVIVSPDGSTHRVAISLQAPNAQGGSGALLRLVSRVSSMLEAQGLYLQHNLPQELLPPPPSPASFSAGPAAFAGNGDGGGDGGEGSHRQDALWEAASVEGDVSGLGAGEGGERETEEARNARYVANMLQSLFTGGGRVAGADRGGFPSQQAVAGGVAEARRHRFSEGMAVSEAARSALRRVEGSEGMEEGAAGMTRDRSSFDWQRGRNIPFGPPGGGNLGALAQRHAGRHREASYYRQTTEPRLIAREQGVGDSGHDMAALDEDSSFSREAGG